LGCHGEGRLNIHCQRIETGDAVKRCSLFDPLADADVQNAACNGCGQTQAATTAVLGKGEFQAAFGRLGRRLGRIRTAGLEARFGDQALPEELLVRCRLWRESVAWASAWMRSRWSSRAWGWPCGPSPGP
jgi:hypothetical protein